jgi:hypothetical protein
MTRARRRLGIAATLAGSALAFATVAAPAVADDPKAEAARSFVAGSQAYARGDFRAAARSFDEAHRLAPRAAAAYNAGLSWEGAGERSRAADDYTRALVASDLGAVERADATGRLRALERTLARLSLSSPPGTRLALDGVELQGSSTIAHVEPGKHELQATYADGRDETRSIVARAGGIETVKLGSVRDEDAPVAPSTDGSSSSDTASTDGHPGGETATSAPDRLPAWIAFGGAAVASGVAIGLFSAGIAARNDFVHGGSTDRALHDKALTLRTGTWVAWTIAGGLAVTGVVFYFTAPPGSAVNRGPSSASAALAVDGSGVTLHVPF